MQKSIFLVTNAKGVKTAHTAVQSFLEHPDGIPMSKQGWVKVVKKQGGYPITIHGCAVEKIPLFRTSQSRIEEVESRIL